MPAATESHSFVQPDGATRASFSHVHDSEAAGYRDARVAHWEAVAAGFDEQEQVQAAGRGVAARYYHRRLVEVYRFIVPPGSRVLEIGCGRGDLLAALQPAQGVGIDFSPTMIAHARRRHPGLRFEAVDAHDLSTDRVPGLVASPDGRADGFDFILLSDLVNDAWDLQTILQRLRPYSGPQTRVVFNFYSRLWAPVLHVARRLGLATPLLRQNWLTTHDLSNLLGLCGYAPLRSGHEILLPLGVPLLANVCNKVLVKLPPLRQLGLTNVLIARAMGTKDRLAVRTMGTADARPPGRATDATIPVDPPERQMPKDGSSDGQESDCAESDRSESDRSELDLSKSDRSDSDHSMSDRSESDHWASDAPPADELWSGGLASRLPTVSVIVPARNESGNIRQILARVPQMGDGTEIVFVEGHSSDDTWAQIERAVADHPEHACQTMRQAGRGKGDAVRLGFAVARGEILMILDADLTVPPEDLPRFYEQLHTGRGEFINGVRLVYPMQDRAMRPLNFIGNKFFGLAFSWLLGQKIKDTLCGTKVLWQRDYARLAAGRAYFGDFDPFGDFDLLFGAAKLNLKIIDLPVRYRERTYGTTNIHRFRHGWLLLKMVVFAAGRMKFV